jgi:predicted DsbA family dithiol-disulfide isomerase
LSLQDLFGGDPANLREKQERQRRVAKDLGLPWGERKKTFNSRLAQELGKWAGSKGRGEPFHHAVFRAYFVDGINIAKKKALIKLAESVGLSGQEAGEILETRKFRDEVDADWKLAYQRGITAVPTFVIGDQAVVGAQPYAVLERFLLRNGARKRSFAQS